VVIFVIGDLDHMHERHARAMCSPYVCDHDGYVLWMATDRLFGNKCVMLKEKGGGSHVAITEAFGP
jgi:hypothetical protein